MAYQAFLQSCPGNLHVIPERIAKSPQVLATFVRLFHRIRQNVELGLGSLVKGNLTGLGCLQLPPVVVL
jgi:hypothetical protein